MIDNIEALLARAAEYGLNLTADQNKLDQSGLDFLVLQAQDASGVTWILRTPKHPGAYQGSLNEAKILNLLRERLSIAIPNWKIHKPDLIAYPRLAGTPAWTYDPVKGLMWNGLDPAQPDDNFLESSARFLAKLHAIEREAISSIDGRIRSISEVRSSLAETCQATKEILNPSAALWQRWMSWLEDDTFWPKEAALVHGDFHPGHILLDDKLSVIGVLDWTEAEIADPSVDFSIFFGCFGRETLAKILKYYEQAGGRSYERLIDHVVERWAAYAPVVAKWGMDHDNKAVIEHAKNHLAETEAQTKDSH